MPPRIIDDQSPLNRLPIGLHPVQRGWLEGLRYSIDIADLAMRRLAIVLYELSGRATADGSILETPLEPEVYVAAMTDSWTFVDAAWRLKRFLIDSRIPKPPGPPLPAPTNAESFKVELDGFRAAVEGIEKIRDGFQHLDNQTARLADAGEAVWGYLNWVVINPESSQAQTSSFQVPVPRVQLPTIS